LLSLFDGEVFSALGTEEFPLLGIGDSLFALGVDLSVSWGSGVSSTK
jgi:hypothetical protein